MKKELLILKMNIRELFKKYPLVINIFKKYGLQCNECFFSEKVNLKEALQSSRLPSEEIIKEIIILIESNKNGK
jgi:hypothetical protein